MEKYYNILKTDSLTSHHIFMDPSVIHASQHWTYHAWAFFSSTYNVCAILACSSCMPVPYCLTYWISSICPCLASTGMAQLIKYQCQACIAEVCNTLILDDSYIYNAQSSKRICSNSSTIDRSPILYLISFWIIKGWLYYHLIGVGVEQGWAPPMVKKLLMFNNWVNPLISISFNLMEYRLSNCF